MKIFPIIPVWIMILVSIILILLLIKDVKKNLPKIFIIIFLFLINLRIMIPTRNLKTISNNLDVLLVIDNTISMNAEDYANSVSRLEGVKNDCKYIIEKLNGARFSIITFNNTSKIVTPYTKDANITLEAINIIKPINELYAKGSSLNTPLEDIIKSLKSSQTKNDRKRIIFFISDGEITNDSPLNSFKEISNYIENGAVLGYGTKKGGYMPFTDDSGKTDYLVNTTDYTYPKAISKIDEANLKKIATDMNVDYINMATQDNINNKIKEIEKLISSDLISSDKENYEDTYYFLVIPLLVLLIIEFNKYKEDNL